MKKIQKLVRKKSKLWISVQRWFTDYQWLIFLFYSIIVFTLAMFGLKKQEKLYNEPYSVLSRIYTGFQILKGLHVSFKPVAPITLEIARVMAFFGTLFVGFKLFSLLLAKQWLLLRLRFISDHIIIFGLNITSYTIANKLSDLGYAVIIVDPMPSSALEKCCQNQGIVVFAEDPTDKFVYYKIRAHQASQIYAFFDNETMNADIAVLLKGLLIGNTSKRIDIFIHIQNSDMCHALKGDEIEHIIQGNVNFFYFNLYELVANQINQKIDSTEDILVIGFHPVLENLLLATAKEMFFSKKRNHQKKTWILLEYKSQNRIKWLKAKYPGLEDVIDFIPCDVVVQKNVIPDPDEIKRLLGNRSISTALIFLPEYQQSIEWAITVQRLIKDSTIDIYIMMNIVSGISELITKESSSCSAFKNIYTIDLYHYANNTNIMKNSLIESMAQLIHGDYLHLQKEKGITSEMNPSVVSWDELPETLRESNREQARGVLDKVRLINADLGVLFKWNAPLFTFTEKEIDKLALFEHNRWMEERIKLGWEKGEKDVLNKKTPYLVPYNELPEDIKELDRDTIRNIPYLLARNGLTIIRKPE